MPEGCDEEHRCVQMTEADGLRATDGCRADGKTDAIQPKQAEAPAPMPDMPPLGEEPSYASTPAEVDDLPF